MKIPQFKPELLGQEDNDPQVRSLHEFNADIRNSLAAVSQIAAGNAQDVAAPQRGMRYIFLQNEHGRTVRLAWRNGSLQEV